MDKKRIALITFIITMLISVNVYATGTVNMSYNKNIPFGFAVKDYLYHFQTSYDIQLVGSDSDIANPNFIKIYKVTDNGLQPIQIKIKKTSESSLTSDISDWLTYGTKVTSFEIVPDDDGSMTDGYYYYYFQCDVTLINFVYDSTQGPAYVVNENSTIEDFYITDVSTKISIENALSKIDDNGLGTNSTLEQTRDKLDVINNNITGCSNLLFDINSNDVDIKYKLDTVNGNLTTISSYLDEANNKLDVLNTNVTQLNDIQTLANHRIGFIIFGIVFIFLIIIGWLSFKNMIYYPFKNIIRNVM